MLHALKRDRFLQIALGLALALLAAAVAVLLARSHDARQRERLLEQVETVWTREVESEPDCYLTLTLSDGRITYCFVSREFPTLSETLFTYDYTAEDESALRVTYSDGVSQRVEVTLSEDGNELTLTPAITSTDVSETWTREAPAPTP